MTRNYQDEAAKLVETLRPAGPASPPLPSAESISEDRIAEFPFFRDGLPELGRAISQKYGEGYGVSFGYGSSKVDRALNQSRGRVVVYYGNQYKNISETVVVFDPGVVTMAGHSFTVDQEDEMIKFIHDLIRQHFA